jgi:ER lumen protein retaining receptor
VFSEILESVAVLPQLILLRQTNVPTVIDSYYLALLGSYRAFYILNWIVRIADKNERHFDPVSVIFGVIQTALYVDFAWVYYSRQRVKLRAGGIVDSDDLERGWIVGRLIGKGASHIDDGDDDNVENDSTNPRKQGGRWGRHGISVSADEDIFDSNAEDAMPLADPAAFEDALSDDEGAPPASKTGQHEAGSSPWADDDDVRPVSK